MEHKDSTTLNLNFKDLTSEDMEIVAYYTLRNNKVSRMMFARVISEISNILTRDCFSRK
jgi:hypothetical protein